MHYVLLSAPWAVLCYYAEDLRLKLPLQVRVGPGSPTVPTTLETPHSVSLRAPPTPISVPRVGSQGGLSRAGECVPPPGPDHPSPATR